MKNMRKRGAVYGVIGLMLCVAVYLNWSYFQTPVELTVSDQSVQNGDTQTSSGTYGEVTAVDAEGTDDKAQAQATAAAAEDYFSQARLSRQTARDTALSSLKETVASENATQEAKTAASNQISALAGNAVKESRIESLIQAKGYSQAVVYIADDSISVVVSPPDGGLKSADTAKIADVVMGETGASASMLRISQADAQANRTDGK